MVDDVNYVSDVWAFPGNDDAALDAERLAPNGTCDGRGQTAQPYFKMKWRCGS